MARSRFKFTPGFTKTKERAMSFDIPDDIRSELEAEIGSDSSPVGIDAKKTHVLILYMLREIEQRLASIEARMDQETS
jgi:hypothetical protein